MPVQVEEIIVQSHVAAATVALEPAQSALHSLLLLVRGQHLPGVNPWVTRTLEAMTAEELERHKLVMLGLHYAVLPRQSWSSFPAYLDRLESIEPAELRDKLLSTYAGIGRCEEGGCEGEPPPVDWKVVLQDAEHFLSFLAERFGQELVEESNEREAYRLILDPPKMQAMIVSHLRHMWDRYLAAEWARAEPMLQDSVAAFRQVDLSGMDRLEAAEWITGQDLEREKWERMLDSAEQVVFVPSPHVGPYLGKFWAEGRLWVFFGARLPQGIQYHAPDLTCAEIVVRLGALADETRLRMLKLVSEEGELTSQEIMGHLELSQSAASRHLKQLNATGYLAARRCNGAKCYRLDLERVNSTLASIASFLQGE